MNPEDILVHPPRVLTPAQREAYFQSGYVAAPDIIPEAWLGRLIELSDEFLKASKSYCVSNDAFDLGPLHCPNRPHVRRLRALVDRHPDFWRFASETVLADIAADLVRPDVKFHSSEPNYKWSDSGEIVEWHQDIPAWPHTNYSLATLGVYLNDVPTAQGPLTCLPGSQRGPIFAHRDLACAWSGAIRDEDLARFDLAEAEDLTGPGGTVIATNCRTVHASRANATDRVRPVALFVYAAADAVAWMPAPTPTAHTGEIMRGQAAHMPHWTQLPAGAAGLEPSRLWYDPYHTALGRDGLGEDL